MKTAKERAEEWLIKNIGVADLDEIDGLEELINSIRKETRHACAEATLDCSEYCEHPNGNMALDPNEVHAACMNVKAV